VFKQINCARLCAQCVCQAKNAEEIFTKTFLKLHKYYLPWLLKCNFYETSNTHIILKTKQMHYLKMIKNEQDLSIKAEDRSVKLI
jgi:hypothetical protein